MRTYSATVSMGHEGMASALLPPFLAFFGLTEPQDPHTE